MNQDINLFLPIYAIIITIVLFIGTWKYFVLEEDYYDAQYEVEELLIENSDLRKKHEALEREFNITKNKLMDERVVNKVYEDILNLHNLLQEVE